mmetsp:Transcript_57148/g.113600  ORF Transcript_57148/g.113600 Transcript_57148/m.113600 type:complete len:80 (+) Transcript_57148:314-553(+)
MALAERTTLRRSDFSSILDNHQVPGMYVTVPQLANELKKIRGTLYIFEQGLTTGANESHMDWLTKPDNNQIVSTCHLRQ